MSIPVYNVDKPFPFDSLVMFKITGELKLYFQACEDISGLGLESTRPEFLALFRKVKYDGTISSNEYIDSFVLKTGFKIIIKKCGKVVVVNPSNEYMSLNSCIPQAFVFLDSNSSQLYDNDLGDYKSYVNILDEDGLNEFLDSYKFEKPKPNKIKRKIFLGDFENDYDDNILLEEI